MPSRPTRNYLTETKATEQVERETRWVRGDRLSTWTDISGRSLRSAGDRLEIVTEVGTATGRER